MPHPHLNEIRLIARHEAGHYVAARCLGFSPGDIVLKTWGKILPYEGTSISLPAHTASCFIISDERLTSAEEIAYWLERRIQVLYAGALAQTIICGELDEEVAIQALDANAADDMKAVKHFTILLRNIRHPIDEWSEASVVPIEALNVRLWNASIALVRREASVIQGLAEIVANTAIFAKNNGVLLKATIERLEVIESRFGAPTSLTNVGPG